MKIILKRQIHQESLDPFGIVQRKQYPFFINSNRLVKFICWVSSVFSPNTAKSTSSPGFNLAGHHFDNREAPREDAKLKSEHKKVIKHVRLYSNENSFIFFYCNISQARLDLSDLFGREWLTTEYMRHSHVHSALLFQKQFKSTKQTVNNRQRKTTKGILWAPSTCGRAIDRFTDMAAIFIY